jgi:hypothetical protein
LKSDEQLLGEAKKQMATYLRNPNFLLKKKKTMVRKTNQASIIFCSKNSCCHNVKIHHQKKRKQNTSQ